MSKPITPLAQLLKERIEQLRYELAHEAYADEVAEYKTAIHELEKIHIILKSYLDELAERTTAGGDVQFSQIVRVLDENYE